MEKSSSALDDLHPLTIEARREAIASDLYSCRNHFADIPAYDLVKLLGVDIDHRENWHHVCAVRIQPLEQVSEDIDSISHWPALLQGHASEKTISEISDLAGKVEEGMQQVDFGFLSRVQQDILAKTLATNELDKMYSSGCGSIAYYSLNSSSSRILRFGVHVGDDGACEGVLSPYELFDKDHKTFPSIAEMYTGYVTIEW